MPSASIGGSSSPLGPKKISTNSVEAASPRLLHQPQCLVEPVAVPTDQAVHDGDQAGALTLVEATFGANQDCERARRHGCEVCQGAGFYSDP